MSNQIIGETCFASLLQSILALTGEGRNVTAPYPRRGLCYDLPGSRPVTEGSNP